jgi:hypothetical protein
MLPVKLRSVMEPLTCAALAMSTISFVSDPLTFRKEIAAAAQRLQGNGANSFRPADAAPNAGEA